MANNVVININAGTARFNRQLDDAKNKIRSTFGHGSVSSIQATSASLRLLEGNMTNNIRAVERFLANTLKLGPALSAAFPVIGAAALGTFIVATAEKLHKFFIEIEGAPEKMRGFFGDLNLGLKVTNDALEVSNARLQSEIATLSGKPANNLAVALLEAKEAADKLNESLGRTITQSYKAIDEQAGGWMKRLGSGIMGNAAVKDIALELGGETGEGGFRARIREKKGKELADEYVKEIQKFQQQIQGAELGGVFKGDLIGSPKGFLGDALTGNMTARLEILRGELANLKGALREINLTDINTSLIQKVAKVQDKNSLEALERPFENKMEQLEAHLAGIQAKMKGLNGDSAAQVRAAGEAEAAKDIAEVTKAMKRKHEVLTDLQRAQIFQMDIDIAAAAADEAWAKKFKTDTDDLDERIRRQKELNAVEASNYEARRNAMTETTLKTMFKEEYGDPNHAADIQKIRTKLTEEADLQHYHQLKLQTQELTAQITLYSRLAEVAGDFSKVHQAQLDAEVAKMQAEGRYTAEQIEQFKKLNALKLESESAARAAADRLATENTKRVGAAAFGGAEEIRRAEIQNALEEAAAKGATAAEQKALWAKMEAEHHTKILLEAGQLTTEWSDQTRVLNQQIAAIKEQIALHGKSLELQHALEELEDRRLDVAIKMTLEQGSALDGVKAFFLEMEKKAEDASKMIYDSLNGVLNKTSDNLANMMSGKVGKGGIGKMWGETFKSIGDDLNRSAIRSGLQRGLGALGHHIPGLDKLVAGKPDGTPSNPIHVVVQGGPGAGGGNAVPNPLGGIFNRKGGIFGGGDQGRGIFSLLEQAPGFAIGGSPEGWAKVGERGPELAYFGSGGHVWSNRDTKNMLGGNTYYYDIDARGAEIGVEGRISSAIDAAHSSAVKNSIRATQEMKARLPQTQMAGRR